MFAALRILQILFLILQLSIFCTPAWGGHDDLPRPIAKPKPNDENPYLREVPLIEYDSTLLKPLFPQTDPREAPPELRPFGDSRMELDLKKTPEIHMGDNGSKEKGEGGGGSGDRTGTARRVSEDNGNSKNGNDSKNNSKDPKDQDKKREPEEPNFIRPDGDDLESCKVGPPGNLNFTSDKHFESGKNGNPSVKFSVPGMGGCVASCAATPIHKKSILGKCQVIYVTAAHCLDKAYRTGIGLVEGFKALTTKIKLYDGVKKMVAYLPTSYSGSRSPDVALMEVEEKNEKCEEQKTIPVCSTLPAVGSPIFYSKVMFEKTGAKEPGVVKTIFNGSHIRQIVPRPGFSIIPERTYSFAPGDFNMLKNSTKKTTTTQGDSGGGAFASEGDTKCIFAVSSTKDPGNPETAHAHFVDLGPIESILKYLSTRKF